MAEVVAHVCVLGTAPLNDFSLIVGKSCIVDENVDVMEFLFNKGGKLLD